MSGKRSMLFSFVLCLTAATALHAQAPPISGSPTIDSPTLLDWPRDVAGSVPDLTEPTSNRLWDLHGDLTNCDSVDLVLSTAGNYHMALRELWHEVLLPTAGSTIQSWYYTTSPPISPDQVVNEAVSFGNLAVRCVPQIAVGPGGLMNTLEALGVTEGSRVPIIRNNGNVILVKKGNPKHIQSIWDLGRADVNVVTSNPFTEPGSFGNYSGSIFNIADADPNPPNAAITAEALFDSVFNSSAPLPKWLAGARIHHREVPWSIAHGQADAGLMFYHLALNAANTFPDLFEIVPLGGTVADPQPLPGNRVGTLFAVRIAGSWSQRQLDARELLMDAFLSEEFTEILEAFGLRRP